MYEIAFVAVFVVVFTLIRPAVHKLFKTNNTQR